MVIFVETKADRHLGKWRRAEHFKDDTLYSYAQMQEMMEMMKKPEKVDGRKRERTPEEKERARANLAKARAAKQPKAENG